MNVFKDFRTLIAARLDALAADGVLPEGLDYSAITVEPPRDASHGDLATNAALVLARQARRKPRELAGPLAEALAGEPAVAGVEIAGPGFINLRLAADYWRERLRDVLRQGTAYGDCDIGAGQLVNIEFVSANPTGPMHVGHCRGAVFGDALAALLKKAGFAVSREYYINDAGAQIDVLARSAHLRYREALGEDIGDIPPGLYPGDYLKPVGADLAATEGACWVDAPEASWLALFRGAASEAMMTMIRDDLAALGITFDVFFSERSLAANGRIEKALAALADKGLIYEGVLEPPKGKLPDDWEPRPQTLFRSTRFGDDVDRALKKSDGSWTYFAADIAYHFDKVERGFYQMIDVWGADHGGYVKRMKAAVAAISDGRASLDVKLCQLVRLLRDGQPMKMSKRAGSFVTLREVVDEVGKDVVRFIMLTRKNDAPLDFDFVKVTEASRDNPVLYVQYVHARVCSVLRKAAEEIDTSRLADAALGRLVHEDELALIRLLAGWPRLIETAALAHEPHRVAFYLYDIASAFHGFWNKGKEDPGLRFIMAEDVELTRARLALISGVATVIASGLELMGVEPVEEM